MTIRFKLTMMAIAGILVANSVLSLVIVEYWGRVWLGEVQTRVGRNLNAARARYDARVERIGFFLRAVASDESIPSRVREKKDAELARVLQKLYASSGLDFVPAGRDHLGAIVESPPGEHLPACHALGGSNHAPRA